MSPLFINIPKETKETHRGTLACTWHTAWLMFTHSRGNTREKHRRIRLPLLIIFITFISYVFFLGPQVFEKHIIEEARNDGSALCSIGRAPFTPSWLVAQVSDFVEAYDDRPVKDSSSGSNLFHAFAQWCIIKHLRPKFIIESGVMLGWGTYMLRKAAGPDAHIIAISPSSPENTGAARKKSFYVDKGKTTYLCEESFSDFNEVDWVKLGFVSSEDFASALVYFDDHQSGYRRLIEAQKVGFRNVMYDDGYPWPGDNYSLKQACDETGQLLSIGGKSSGDNFYPYHDDFSQLVLKISLEQKQCIFRDTLKRLDVYYEFPPLWEGDFRGIFLDRMTEMRQSPLFDSIEAAIFLGNFKNLRLSMGQEAARYTFFTYAVLSDSDFEAAGCLGSDLPKKYVVE